MATQVAPAGKMGNPGNPAGETPEKRLIRIGNRRVNRAIADIAAVGKLRSLKPTQAQVAAMIAAISRQVEVSKRLLESPSEGTHGSFQMEVK